MDRKRDRIDVRNDVLRLSDDVLCIEYRLTSKETAKSTKMLFKKNTPRTVSQMLKRFLGR
jgi:hypothetical protein